MIDDLEMRALFKAEGEEHLQTLENGLLRLEADPRDAAVLEEVFRSAHSLKGAARMLGVLDVETLAHHFEDELGKARRGHVVMSSATVDRLYHGLDAMRRLVREACGGEDALVDMPSVLGQLRDEAPPAALAPGDGQAATGIAAIYEGERAEAGSTSNAPGKDDSSVSDHDIADAPLPLSLAAVSRPSHIAARVTAIPPVSAEPDSAPMTTIAVAADELLPPPVAAAPTAAVDESLALVSPSTFTIDTIRVEPQKLDALMTLAGEMAVTTTRVERSLAAFDDLMALWEEWGRDAATLRSLSPALLDGLSHNMHQDSFKQIARFQAREPGRLERMGRILSQLERTSDEEVTRLGVVSGELNEAIRGMRLLPFSTLFNLFPRLVRDLSREQAKEVRLVVEGGAVTADKHLLEEVKDPLMHLIRNAIDHGIETPEERLRQGKPRLATLCLRASQTATDVVIEIADDGRGLDEEAIRRTALRKGLCSASEIAALSPPQVQMLIFSPGFSTSALITDVSGRGVGLDVVRTNVERIKGSVSVESDPGRGCTFQIQTPITLATTHVLLVQVAQWSYALPLEAVLKTSLVSPQSVFSIEGRPAMNQDGQPVPVAHLADLLQMPPAPLPPSSPTRHLLPCILITIGTERLGLLVDALIDEQEVVLKPFGGMLRRVRNVSAATILSTGEICMVLNPKDLIKSAQKRGDVRAAIADRPSAGTGEEAERKKVLLLAEDSITTRTQEKRILESAGYEVVTAVDGADAFNKLGTRLFDAVVSDIEMPNMDGLTLTARIRQDTKYKELPIILVTSLASDEDRRRGSEMGANAYITKGTFEQKVLLDTLRRLV